MDCFMGVDMGTSGTRAVAFGKDGQEIAASYEAIPTHEPRTGWREQDPRQAVDLTVSCLRNLARALPRTSHPVGVSFSSALGSLIPLDGQGRVLGPAQIWEDSRAVDVAEALQASEEGDFLYRQTGCPPHPMFPVCKMLWMREQAPELWAQVKRWASLKEFLWHELFGEWGVDPSIASAYGLMDLRSRRWAGEILDLVHIRSESLSSIVSGTRAWTGIQGDYQDALSSLKGVPFFLGAGDGMLSNLGVGALDSETTVYTVGTSGAVRRTVSVPVLDPQRRTWCHCLDDGLYVAGGAINNGGLALNALEALLGEEEGSSHDLDQAAEGMEAGSRGLLFLPFFCGERSPDWNARARGALLGLSPGHTRAHLYRAAMEGVLFRLCEVGRALEEVMGSPGNPWVWATGGYTSSRAWVQIHADILGREMKMATTQQVAARGAAVLGMQAVGLEPAWTRLQESSRIVQPRPGPHQTYLRLSELFSETYRQIKPFFKELAPYGILRPPNGCS